MKTDTHAGSCTGHKGTIVLARSSTEQPRGYVAIVREQKFVVVTFDGQYEPGSAVYTRLVQIDYETGANLHEGEMAVVGWPVTPPPAVLRPTGLDASGHDVVLHGTGDFPGAGGGATFTATFQDFLEIDPQRPSPATSAVSY
jgi:hypothetical protein